MKSRFIIVLALVLSGLGCAPKKPLVDASSSENQPKYDQGADWTNPVLSHMLTPREFPFRSFPFDPKLTDHDREDSLGFVGFLDRMNVYFQDSNISAGEADDLYIMLYAVLAVSNDVGGEKGVQPNNDSLAKFKQRLAIKRLNGQKELDVFYKYYSCGWNYSHMRGELSPGENAFIKKEEMESWVARMPC